MKTSRGHSARGFPNGFYVGIGQNALSANFTAVFDNQARHVAWIIHEAMARQARTVQPTEEAQDAWVAEIRRTHQGANGANEKAASRGRDRTSLFPAVGSVRLLGARPQGGGVRAQPPPNTQRVALARELDAANTDSTELAAGVKRTVGAMTFADIPEVVIDYVRETFAAANNRVSRKMSDHPSMHEESLDHTLIDELTDAPAAIFAEEQAAVVIESHFLGGRRMWDRWEIADIAIMIMLRRGGHLVERKVVLLQTKRLYSSEVPVEPLEMDDYAIGVGRLGDRTDPSVPLTTQRTFSFDDTSRYSAMHAGSPQVGHIEEYVEARGIPVFYAFYNPPQLPCRLIYPSLSGARVAVTNDLGCRVQPMTHVHHHLSALEEGQAPSFGGLKTVGAKASLDPFSNAGWRLENFVADEVLQCRQGALFDGSADQNLEYLFYRRSRPIQAAISITIEVGGGD